MPLLKGTTPPKNKLAEKVKRALNPDAVIDESEMSEEERAQLAKTTELAKAARDFKFLPVEQIPEKVCIVFDNSTSMLGQSIQDAKDGVIEYMRECLPNETAVKIQLLNSNDKYIYDDDGAHVIAAPELNWTADLPQLAQSVEKIVASGMTPLYDRIRVNIAGDKIKPTRMIVFSDGAPDTRMIGLNETIAAAKAANLAIDTCLIANIVNKESDEYVIMKRLADETGGIFIVFEKGKCSFKHGFKYLTKGNRLLLMDSNFKAKLEAGEI